MSYVSTFFRIFAGMKQTLEDYLRQDDEFRKTLLAQDGGIMKYWAQHPDAEFDTDLFDNYEKQIVESYLQANKRNRAIASLSEDELKKKARSWISHTEKEIHYKIALQPLIANLPVAVSEQINRYIDEYLADAYRDYRRCCYPEGITPVDFYNEVVSQYGTGGLARYCMDYILREHHHHDVWLKRKSESVYLTEFFIRQYSEVISEQDTYKMLRQAVKEMSAGKTPDDCRHEAIKTMNLVKNFSQMIYSSAEVGISDCTGHYIVDKDFLRNLASSETALRLLAHTEVSPLHECFFYYVSLLNDISRIWAARLLKDCNIDMHELEKETGAILYPVTEPSLRPDGADHGNYKYYIDKDFNDPLDAQCCIYDEKQAKELKDQSIKMLKHFDIRRDLESIKADELKRRKVNAKYEKKLQTTPEKQRKSRRQVDVKTATHSFKIDIPKIGANERTKRLSFFYADLARNGKYIQEDTNPDVFLKNFTGVHTGEKIVWTAGYKQLLYLIQKLHKVGVLNWNTEKPKPGLRQMICIVFKIRDLEYKEVEGKIDKVLVQCIHEIEIKNMNTKIDAHDEGLDPIIRHLLFGEESIDDGLTNLIKSESEK